MHPSILRATAFLIACGIGAAVAAEKRPLQDAVPATPPGVTLKIVRIGQGLGVPGSNSNQPRDRLIFATANTMTLYTYDKDGPGKSACVGECATTWPPFIADQKAVPVGDWSLVTRDDGTRQWAFRDRPLYTFTKDVKAKGTPRAGAGDAGVAAEMDNNDPNRLTYNIAASGHDVDGRQIVEIRPEEWMQIPAGISVMEVRTAPGQSLTDIYGRTLYMLTGNPAKSKVSDDWSPVQAPQMALPVGDFTIVARQDGLLQWAYHGKALYRFKGDVDYGDANGGAADGRFQVAYVMRYFMPANVAVRKDRQFGGLLTTADNHTLYAREIGADGADGAQRAERGNPTMGMNIGVTSCDKACEQTWKPLLAPDNAMPEGYWTAFTRADGKKQWGYYGYALYSYAAEGPGQITGHLMYDDVTDFELPSDGSARQTLRIRWRAAPP